jgi:hypothetical protein
VGRLDHCVAIEGVQVVLSLVAGVPLLRARVVELIALMGGIQRDAVGIIGALSGELKDNW